MNPKIAELAERLGQSAKLVEAHATNPNRQAAEMTSRAKFLNSEVERLTAEAGSAPMNTAAFKRNLDAKFGKATGGIRIAQYRSHIRQLEEMLDSEASAERANLITQKIAEQEKRIVDEEKLLELAKMDMTDEEMRAHGIQVIRDERDNSSSREVRGSGARFRDVLTGQEYRALKHGERVSRNENPSLSPGKYLRGALLGDWEGAEAELRTYSGNLGTTGGNLLLPEFLSSLFIDAARNQTRVIQAGAQTLMLPNRSVRIAKLHSDAAASYKQENAAAVDDEMEFGCIDMEARTLVCYATLSQEILQDAMNLDQIVANAFGEALSREMDRAALFGAGVAGQPLGLYNYDGVGLVAPNANGFTLADYDEFSEAIQDIENANGEAKAAIFSPRTAAKLRELKEATTNAYLTPPPFFNDLKRFTTNQVPNDLDYGTEENASAAFVGDFSQLLFGIRQELRIETSAVAGEAWQRYQHKIRAVLRYDVAVLRPSHFSVVKGIK